MRETGGDLLLFLMEMSEDIRGLVRFECILLTVGFGADFKSVFSMSRQKFTGTRLSGVPCNAVNAVVIL